MHISWVKEIEPKLPSKWEEWCERGKYTIGAKRRAVRKSLNPESGEVRGYYSDLLLNPEAKHSDSLYPSFEHTTYPKADNEAVVEARIINDMKSHLSEEEFWHAIEHLYAVGVEKGKIAPPPATRRDQWVPLRNYEKKVAASNTAQFDEPFDETCSKSQPLSESFKGT